MKPNQRTIMVLGAGENCIPVILAAKALGLHVMAVDPSSHAPGLPLADIAHCLDLADFPGLVALAKDCPPSGVIAFAAEYPVPAVAHLCRAFGLHGLTPEAARLSTNKKEMRRVFAAAGTPSPMSISVHVLEQAEIALREVARIAPLAIFKPALSNAGRGVTQIHVNASSTAVRAAFDHAMNNTRGDGMLVEEFIDGPEYSVECVAYDGRIEVVAVTDKLTTGAPHFVEIGHSQPAAISPEAYQTLVATAIAGARALGIDWAGIHAEIRLSSVGPRVMEIAGRFGGGYINSHLVPLSTGIDLPQVAVLLALGEKPDLRVRHNHGAAMRFLTAIPGVVTRISGLNTAHKLPGVCVAEVYVKPDDRVQPLIDGSRRVGHVICDGDNAAVAVARAEIALKTIQIQTTVNFEG